MHHCFISDLHLCPNSDSDALFSKFLKNNLEQVSNLYILGDLFEYWVGDDAMDSYHLLIAEKIKSLQDKISNIYFMPGNRDFLVDSNFLNLSGMQLINDPHLIDVNKKIFLLSHGDSLCTLDRNYQRFRFVSRHPIIRKIFLSLPVSLRKKIAGELRKEKKHSNYDSKIYDVCDNAVKNLLLTHKASNLIHGHTHKPGIHYYDGNLNRLVLGDWHSTAKIATIDEQGIIELTNIS